MSIPRMALLAVVIEAATILVLVVIVALTGPADAGEAQAYAERLGTWVGPGAGFVLCVLGGWFVARRLREGHVKRGFILGAMVAALDAILLLASGSAFQLIFVASNVGRMVAGSLGGWLASRSAPPAEATS